jgi:hypothetical protein
MASMPAAGLRLLLQNPQQDNWREGWRPVFPAQAGIQGAPEWQWFLDSGFRRSDEVKLDGTQANYVPFHFVRRSVPVALRVNRIDRTPGSLGQHDVVLT